MPRKTSRRGGQRTRRQHAADARRDQLARITVLLDEADGQFSAEHDPDGVWGLSEPGFALVDQAARAARAALQDCADAATCEQLGRVVDRLEEFRREYDAWGFAATGVYALFDDARDSAQRACGALTIAL